MPIEVEKREDGALQRVVLAGLFASKPLLAAVSAKWKQGADLFGARGADLIAGWCVDHFRKFGEVPNGATQTLFDRWASGNQDDEFRRTVLNLVEAAAAEKPPESEGFLIDTAQRVFNAARLRKVREGLDIALRRGDVAAGETLLEESKRVELGLGSGINVLSDDAAWDRMFNIRRRPLLELPPALRDFYQDDLCEDSFAAWFAPFKRGKSYVIQDLAWRCVEQGVPVAYFECGDMSEPQILQRWGARIMNRPLEVGPRGGVYVRRPVHIETTTSRTEMCRVEYQTPDEFYDRDVTPEEVWQERYYWKKRHGDIFKLTCHPAGTLSITAAEQMLDGWEQEGFVPKICLFDYADLLQPTPGIKEGRDQHNDTWRRLRALAQKRHCLVGTVTQCNAAASTAWILTRRHFAEDVRKFAHVSSFYGLNQTDDEKLAGVYRMNCLMGRHRDTEAERCVFAAGNLSCGNPFEVSAW